MRRRGGDTVVVDLERLYRRRGDAFLRLKHWPEAVDDYSHVVTDATTDEELLTNRATALVEVMLTPAKWTVLKPTEMKSDGGATLTLLDDHSILAGGVNPPSDQYTVKFIVPERTVIQSIRLEALTHDSLPGQGPGRNSEGVFALVRWNMTAKDPDVAGSPRSLSFRTAFADYSFEDAPLYVQGVWNIT